eukprot:scaffold237995_cov41-Tisochrysis_lutea.AAC.1
MLRRYINVLRVLDRLVIDDVYTTWLGKQARDVKERGAEIKRIIRDEDVTSAARVCLRVCEPVVRVLRMTDSKLGATLGKVYAYMLQVDVHLRNPIEGLDEHIRKKIHNIFMARWTYMHVPVMTAAFRFDPEFCSRDFDSEETADVKQ